MQSCQLVQIFRNLYGNQTQLRKYGKPSKNYGFPYPGLTHALYVWYLCVWCVCIAAFKSAAQVTQFFLKRKQRIHDHDVDSMRHSQHTLKTLSIWMPLESEKRIHDIWHNTSVYLRTCTCTIVYTHTHTYSYTNEQVNNTSQIHNDGQLKTANVCPQNRLVSTHF